MKFICTLLAFLVLTLSVQPVCASISAGDNCCSERSCEDEAGANESENESQKSCSTTCNPFQVCSCCVFMAVPLQQPNFTFEQPISYSINSSWAGFKCPFIEAPILGFWQPPKLS